jgi:hypothetical protein
VRADIVAVVEEVEEVVEEVVEGVEWADARFWKEVSKLEHKKKVKPLQVRLWVESPSSLTLANAALLFCAVERGLLEAQERCSELSVSGNATMG